MGHHGVDIPPADEYTVPGLPHSAEGVGTVPVRLGEDGYTEALALHHPRNNRRAEAGMVNVGVSGDEEEIVVPPAPLLHIRAADGKKVVCVHWVFTCP